MNISQIKTFIEVVEAESFSVAARKLGVSQPAVTLQVQNLEATVGSKLLDRRYKKVELTEAGEIFLPFAYQFKKSYSQMNADIEGLSGEICGSLRLALSTTPGDYIVPSLLGEFLKIYPRVNVSISVRSSSTVAMLIENREAELGMVGAHLSNVGVDFTECGHDELILIAPPEWKAPKKDLELKDLSDERWVGRTESSGTQRIVEDIFAEAGSDLYKLDYVVELGTGEAIVNAVEGGLGIAIVSRYVAKKALALKTIQEVKVEKLPFRRPFYVVEPRKTLTRAAAAFKEFLLEKL